MVLPTNPATDLIVRHTGFTLSAIKALFDPMFGLRCASKLRCRSVVSCIAEIVVLLHDRFVAIFVTNDDTGLFGSATRTPSACFNSTL